MCKITIKIIYDNCKTNPALEEGWGFSALIETDHRKILFDTGSDLNAFFYNAEKMGIALGEITDVVFSHKHYDHVTGCVEILGKVKENCRVYIPKGFPMRKIPKNLLTQVVQDFAELDKDVFSMVLKGGFLLHEQSLIFETAKGLVVITGCAHPGIVNIVETVHRWRAAPIYLVLGGFHLFKKDSGYIDEIVEKFQFLKVEKVAPCHCSGESTLKKFQKAYPNDFYKIGTGTVLTIS
ncbi:MAG: MBL fold metallo-hydrolase [Verrucomicrobia bacterium]|nr:MBL fold metallo-hydrolase [Verrucomicrobiota bacterium]